MSMTKPGGPARHAVPAGHQPGRRVSRRTALLVVPAAALAIGLAAGGAYAYFSSSGKGTNGATVGTMQTVTLVTATTAPSTPLLPGGSGDAVVKITNPNGFAVTLVSVTSASGSITADSGHAACTTTGVSFTSQTGLSTTIAASSTVTVDLPGAVSMSTSSSAGCQGATFSIPVTIAVQKS
jgi:predicted ribosomally synthesized peptide with SipW-like signal peptide